MSSSGIIVLAAGEAARMGSPKQLLSYQGMTLVERACTIALETTADKVVVVLGAYQEEIEAVIQSFPVYTSFNQDWKTGMGSSIRTGLKHLLGLLPTCEKIAISLVDQPFMTGEHLQLLLNMTDKTRPLVATSYGEKQGVPAAFSKQFFPELLTLKGKEGAKMVIATHRNIVLGIPCENTFDVDTPEDYQKLTGWG